ncbi:MAG: hypothetical protein Q8P56_04515 [Candidatus Uhrbacteria bacterium]|nr:hypothetical protein [Candidatus Uhrbacteria bacterium]
MPGQEITNDELVRMVKDGFDDYHDPRLPALVLMLVRKGIFSVEDVRRLIQSNESVKAS